MTDEPKRPLVGSDSELIEPDTSSEYVESLNDTDASLLADEQPLFSPRELLNNPVVTHRLRKVLVGMIAVALAVLALVLIIRASSRFNDSSIPVPLTATPRAFALSGSPDDALRVSEPTDSVIADIAWSPDSTRLAINNYEDLAYIWDVTSGAQAIALDDSGTNVVWSPDGTRLLVTRRDLAFVADARTGERLYVLTSQSRIVASPVWLPDNSAIVSVGGGITFYSAQTGWAFRTEAADSLLMDEGIGRLVWTQGGLFASSYRTLVRFDAATWDDVVVSRVNRQTSRNEQWLNMTVSADNRYLAVLRTNAEYQNWTLQLFIWDTAAATDEPLQVLTLAQNDQGNDSPVDEAFLSPDGTQVALTDGAMISIVDLSTGEHLRDIDFEARVVDVDWSPDGQHLAACSEHYVRVYSLTSADE